MVDFKQKGATAFYSDQMRALQAVLTMAEIGNEVEIRLINRTVSN